MSDITLPAEIDAAIDNKATGQAIAKAGGHSGYVVRGADIAGLYSSLDGSNVNSFAHLSSSGLDMTLDGGEAFVYGWLCRDRETTVSLPASSEVTVCVGYDPEALLGTDTAPPDNDNIVIAPEADFTAEQPYLPLYDVTTTSSSISSVDSVRPMGPSEARSDSFASASDHDALRDEFDDLIGGNGTINGDLVIDTSTGSNSFVISRNGGYNQALMASITDTSGGWTYENDEEKTTLTWTVNANDTENSDGTDANSAELQLRTDPSGSFFTLDGDTIYHAGNSDFLPRSGGTITGSLTVEGSEITMPNATGNSGLMFGSGVAYSVYEGQATMYAYSSEGSTGWRFRNPDDAGNMFTVDNTTGDGWLRGGLDTGGRITQDGNDVVDSPDGEYEIQVDGTDGAGIINFKTQ